MLKISNSKTTALLVLTVFATVMVIGPTTSSFDLAFAHYGVDKDKCKNNEDYYEDNEKDCDKNLREHYGEDYDGNFGSKDIDDNDHHDDHGKNNNGENSASQGIGQSQSSEQNSQVVSGDDTEASGNNINLQNQENTGNNALAQQ